MRARGRDRARGAAEEEEDCMKACGACIAAAAMAAAWCGPAVAFPSNWPQEYLNSLEDARNPTEAKISRDLIAVVPGCCDGLMWEQGNGRVLMETWTDDQYYPKYHKAGDVITVSSAHLIWVSSPVETKGWVMDHAVSAENLTPRLKQLFGMPPDADKTYFVEFWVNPADLFRPSPDPEATDREAELAFPVSPFVTISQEYKDWFNNLVSISYTSDTAHPWTRLGYTYDWGNPYNHVGPSEWVISAGASVEIASIAKTGQYMPLPPTVLDLGTETAHTADHVVISGCIPGGSGRQVDVYLLFDDPSGVRHSLTPRGLVPGEEPYFADIPDPASRTCVTLLDYTVGGGLMQGEWSAALAVVIAGAPLTAPHILKWDTRTLTIMK
jgi:hypothetical protein